MMRARRCSTTSKFGKAAASVSILITLRGALLSSVAGRIQRHRNSRSSHASRTQITLLRGQNAGVCRVCAPWFGDDRMHALRHFLSRGRRPAEAKAARSPSIAGISALPNPMRPPSSAVQLRGTVWARDASDTRRSFPSRCIAAIPSGIGGAPDVPATLPA